MELMHQDTKLQLIQIQWNGDWGDLSLLSINVMTFILINQDDLHSFDVRWLQYQAYTGIT